MSDWQPIETAPRDVSVIVYADDCVGEASRPDATGRWWWTNTDEHDIGVREIFPTHWMPMPPPPAS
jgi:hypothetical protein